MGSARFVWELSRAALAGTDGVVVVIKVFMDESGTHDRSPVVTVGAYFGKPREWERFTKRWNWQKRPISVFRSADCANLRGEFAGWSKTERDRYVSQLLPILPFHALGGAAVGINMNDFSEALKYRPKLKAVFGSPYATCFQWAVQLIIDEIDKRPGHQKIAFFHEQNDFETEAHAAFKWVRDNRNRHRGPMTITFASKEQFVPLQAADVLAYEANKLGRDPTKSTVRRSLQALDPDKTRLRILGYAKENMPWLVTRLETMQEEIKTFGHVLSFWPEEPQP